MIGQLDSNGHRDKPRPANEFNLTAKSKLFASPLGSPYYLGDPDLLGMAAVFSTGLRNY